jgi:alkaline phosphatase D
MPSVNVPVQWQIATDENMSKVVLRGTAIATPELGHSIRVVVGGLQPDRWYWYQFKAGNEVSRIGRTRTAPAFGTPSTS